MRKIILPLLFATTILFSQRKSDYDLSDEAGKMGLSKSNSIELSQRISNNIIDFTLIAGGYFTVGTTNGLASSKLDDNCQITYGHPYAKTSYPLFSIDGDWYKYDDYFLEAGQTLPGKENKTLSISSIVNGFFSLEFFMTLQSDEKSIKIVQRITNLDSVAHTFGSGLVIDPALGKWGDGTLKYNNKFITNDTSFTINSSYPQIDLWERSVGAKGIGAEITFTKPADVLVGNWNTLYNENGITYTQSELRKLYDLVAKTLLETKQLSYGEELVTEVTLSLVEPDFSSQVFTRWDLPNFISIEDGALFPRSLKTFAEIFNSNSTFINANLNAELSSGLTPATSDYPISISSNNSLYQSLYVSSSVSYEDKISEAVIKITNNGQVLDEFHRNVFVPATPVSDSGLIVKIDTLRLSNLPVVDFTFEVKNEENEALISNLATENIFLYENGERIQDYSFLKDTSGGVNSADIVFVLDVTGSMGNEIDDVKNNVVEFADSLAARGVDYRLGLVTFLDENETVLDFTKDKNTFRNWIGAQYAHGGGDGPENSLQALLTASQFNFRPETKKLFIWVTDADYHEQDWATQLKRDEVINALLSKDITVNAIGSTAYKSGFYDPIITPTGGNYYDILGNFRDVLMDISRFRASGKYIISYTTQNIQSQSNMIKLEIRYNGLGGNTTATYSFGRFAADEPVLKFYPNPFNPTITFLVKRKNYLSGNIKIFNVLGECVKSFTLDEVNGNKIMWDAKNNVGLPVAAGFYVVQLSLKDNLQKDHIESAKILYLK